METKVTLSSEDLTKINKSISQYRNLAIFFVLPLLIGVLGYILKPDSTFFIVVGVVSFLLFGAVLFAFFIVRKDITAGVKYVSQGLIEEKRIRKSGSSFTFELLGENKVRIEEVTPSGKINSEEPIELAPGVKDLLSYFLNVNDVDYKVTRLEFFSFEIGSKVRIERLTSGKVLNLEDI